MMQRYDIYTDFSYCMFHEESEDGEWVRYDDAQAEISPLIAERDHWKRIARHAGVCMTCQGPNGAPEPYGCSDCLNTGWSGEYHNGLADAENELNQALARAATAAMDMRERAAGVCAHHLTDEADMLLADMWTEYVRALPIDPDAQKALDKLLAKVREDAIREAASIIKYACHDDMTRDEEADAIYALLNDGGRDE